MAEPVFGALSLANAADALPAEKSNRPVWDFSQITSAINDYLADKATSSVKDVKAPNVLPATGIKKNQAVNEAPIKSYPYRDTSLRVSPKYQLADFRGQDEDYHAANLAAYSSSKQAAKDSAKKEVEDSPAFVSDDSSVDGDAFGVLSMEGGGADALYADKAIGSDLVGSDYDSAANYDYTDWNPADFEPTSDGYLPEDIYRNPDGTNVSGNELVRRINDYKDYWGDDYNSGTEYFLNEYLQPLSSLFNAGHLGLSDAADVNPDTIFEAAYGKDMSDMAIAGIHDLGTAFTSSMDSIVDAIGDARKSIAHQFFGEPEYNVKIGDHDIDSEVAVDAVNDLYDASQAYTDAQPVAASDYVAPPTQREMAESLGVGDMPLLSDEDETVLGVSVGDPTYTFTLPSGEVWYQGAELPSDDSWYWGEDGLVYSSSPGYESLRGLDYENEFYPMVYIEPEGISMDIGKTISVGDVDDFDYVFGPMDSRVSVDPDTGAVTGIQVGNDFLTTDEANAIASGDDSMSVYQTNAGFANINKEDPEFSLVPFEHPEDALPGIIDVGLTSVPWMLPGIREAGAIGSQLSRYAGVDPSDYEWDADLKEFRDTGYTPLDVEGEPESKEEQAVQNLFSDAGIMLERWLGPDSPLFWSAVKGAQSKAAARKIAEKMVKRGGTLSDKIPVRYAKEFASGVGQEALEEMISTSLEQTLGMGDNWGMVPEYDDDGHVIGYKVPETSVESEDGIVVDELSDDEARKKSVVENVLNAGAYGGLLGGIIGAVPSAVKVSAEKKAEQKIRDMIDADEWNQLGINNPKERGGSMLDFVEESSGQYTMPMSEIESEIERMSPDFTKKKRKK